MYQEGHGYALRLKTHDLYDDMLSGSKAIKKNRNYPRKLKYLERKGSSRVFKLTERLEM